MNDFLGTVLVAVFIQLLYSMEWLKKYTGYPPRLIFAAGLSALCIYGSYDFYGPKVTIIGLSILFFACVILPVGIMSLIDYLRYGKIRYIPPKDITDDDGPSV